MPSHRELVTLLHAAHDRLSSRVDGLSEADLGRQSYATEWTVADVLSHLGSGAEIGALRYRAEGGPSFEEQSEIWATWNAKSFTDKAADAITADAGYLERLDARSDEELAAASMSFGDFTMDGFALLQARVSEVTLHSWDIDVALDDGATLWSDGVPLAMDNAGVLVAFAAQPPEDMALRVTVTTTDPDERIVLSLVPGDSRVESDGSTYDDAPEARALTLPAEAFVRLVYGRLDPDHTPPVSAEDAALLDLLRPVFPGV